MPIVDCKEGGAVNWTVQIVNGLSFGFLLFLLSSGLSLSFGVMRVLNLNHGGLFAIGAFVGYSVQQAGAGFPVACLAGAAAAFVLGALEQRLMLWRIRGDELAQSLATFGVVLILADVEQTIWGATAKRVEPPSWLGGSVDIGGGVLPVYRIAVIAFGVIVAVALFLLLERTRLGSIVRGGVDDDELLRLQGVNLRTLFMWVFAAGAGIAGLGGVLGGPILGAYVGEEYDVLTLALVVVVIGGLGSIEGALVGALFVGLINNLGTAAFPTLSAFLIYVPMILVLAIRPNGLLARRA